MTPEERAYIDAVTELKRESGVTKEAIDNIEGWELVLDPWSADERMMLPKGIRDILLARHVEGVTTAKEYAAEVKDLMVLRVRSVVSGYNNVRREGIRGDLFVVDRAGRVRINLDVLEDLDEEGSAMG